MASRFLLLLLFAQLVGCNLSTKISERQVEVACAMCIYELEGANACYWAALIDGVHYTVQGYSPKDHAPHAPDGMCNMKRQATVAGEIRGKVFVASKFDLLPAENLPASPTFDDSVQHP